MVVRVRIMVVAAIAAGFLALGARGAQAEQDEDGAEAHVQEGQVPLERALGDLVRRGDIAVVAGSLAYAAPSSSSLSVERAEATEQPAACATSPAAAALAFLLVVARRRHGRGRTCGAVTAAAAHVAGAGPGVEQGDARLGGGQGDEEEGGRGERGEAEGGDEEGGRAEEGEEVGDGGEDGDGEEGELVLLVGGGVLVREGLDEGFLFCKMGGLDDV